MFKKIVMRNWLYILLVVGGSVMIAIKFSQGNWQLGMIWLAATAYWAMKLYQDYQVLKQTKKEWRKHD